MTSKSICFLCHPFHRGGVTRWMIDAAEEYVNRGWKTWFVTVRPDNFITGKKRPSMYSLLSTINGLDLIAPEVNRSFELGTMKRRSISYTLQIMKHIPAGVPVILSDDESIWHAGSLISKKYPVIGVLHSDDEVYYNLLERFKLYLSGIVAVSERIKKKAEEFNPGKPVSIIPCSIPLPELDRKVTDELLNIIWVGRIEERQKRVSDIPLVADQLRKAGANFIWTIAGHGDEAQLRAKISMMELDNFFRFTGWLQREQLFSLLDESDILVLTSNFEGMSVVVMEALSKGVGVASTRVSGVEDLSKDPLSTDSLRLYNVGNVKDAAGAIINLSKIEENERVMASRRLAEKYFSIQACVDSYISVISGLGFVNHPVKKYGRLRLELYFQILISSFLSFIRNQKYKMRASNKNR